MSQSSSRPRMKTWHYEGIQCELRHVVPAVVGATCLAPGHPWHGLPPRQCTLRGGRVDCRGFRRCYLRDDEWVFELFRPADGPSCVAHAEFEVELLADAAAFIAQGGAL